jgi:hypothetical protein
MPFSASDGRLLRADHRVYIIECAEENEDGQDIYQ